MNVVRREGVSHLGVVEDDEVIQVCMHNFQLDQVCACAIGDWRRLGIDDML